MPATALDPVSEAAVGWLVTLHSGAADATERARFDAWLAASPLHRATWQRLAGALDQGLAPARGTPAAGALLGRTLAHANARTQRRRRVLRGALGLGGLASAATLLLAERQLPLRQLAADLRTGTGERRTFTLPDGSTLTLDARSAVDLDFAPGRRRVRLRQGALLAQAAPADAPFVVQTPHGGIQALGTRFSVRLEDARTRVGMLAHATRITTAGGAQHLLAEGRSAHFDARSITPDQTPPQAWAAWANGMVEAHDQPLGEVVDALRAYRSGFIRIAPAAAALRVYGSYALDGSERALHALAETLPITVRVYQRGWLVVIETS